MGVTEEEMMDYYVSVSKSVPEDFPVYLYNIPQCSGNDLTPATVNRILAQAKNVVGIKYSFADIERFRQYLLCGSGGFDVIVGPDRLLLPGLAMGCAGTVAGCSQCDPTPFVQCYEAFTTGDISRAQAASRRINALCDTVRAGSSIAYTKAALESEGLPRMFVRQPAKDLNELERQSLAVALQAYHAAYPELSRDIGISA